MHPRQPNFQKAGFILLSPVSGRVLQTLPFLINPEKLDRSFEVSAAGQEGERSSPLRLTGPARETISLEAKIEVADALERGEAVAKSQGVRPFLSALQLLIYPRSRQIFANDRLQDQGALQIIPMEQPLTLFVWGTQQLVPVRVQSLSINEELFSPKLYPMRASVSLTLRVLSIDDLGLHSMGGRHYMSYLRGLESSARKVPSARPSNLGVRHLS